MGIPHYEKVNKENIVANFTNDLKHRSSLIIPFLERNNNNFLCIIGQNPSVANQEIADKTLLYFEKFVFKNLPQYSGIIMLNLFSRIDTNKDFDTDLERVETESELKKQLQNNADVLLAFGAKQQDKAYKFYSKFQELKPLLRNKNVFKIDIGDTNYPPHPGNPKILYNKLDLGITRCLL